VPVEDIGCDAGGAELHEVFPLAHGADCESTLGKNILDTPYAPCYRSEGRAERFCGIMYTVYGDESHDETQQRVFAVAGLFGDETAWESVKKRWADRTGGKLFHAVDCESDTGDFADSPHSENLRLYKDLAKLLANSNLLGYGHAMDIGEFFALFPEAVENQPYYMCFQEVVTRFAQYTSVCIPPDKVECIFDLNHDVEYNAALLYSYMVNLPEWKFHQFLADKISFASRKEPGIQMADLVARETMKHMDNIVGPVKRLPRLSMRALARTRRFKFDFFPKEYFQDLKRNIGRLIRPGGSISEYKKWREGHSLVDNAANRLRYMTWLRSMQNRGSS
jgi:hypothetical protein